MGLVFIHSPFHPRCARLAILYLSLLADFAFSALFFSLNEEQAPPFLFWESMLDNLWVGVYSTLLSALALLLPALAFSIPGKLLLKIKDNSATKSELNLNYKLVKRKVLCWRIVGFTLFLELSLFLNVYLVAFCEVASHDTALAWLLASGLSLAMELVVF